ncbi:DUF982 domain-containing protein [Rhizobium sp. RAF56]|uniref:DUF982 domain-containing protein n=1 Tax=Rhizobium sp. RAF56 TaxID=3233062 RepID=UPI003F94A717
MAHLRIVTVKAALHGEGDYSVLSTVEALAGVLLNQWPPKYQSDDVLSPHYLARQACIAALEGKSTPAEARAAFVKACDEADIDVLPPGA